MSNNTIERPLHAVEYARAVAIVIGVLTVLALGLAAALWLAGCIYFAVDHHNPLHAGWWGWFDGVSAYLDGRASKERRHLLGSAVLALVIVFGAPLLGWASIQSQRAQRELHGSACFATEREIRKAGLL